MTRSRKPGTKAPSPPAKVPSGVSAAVWLAENAAAVEASNAYVETHGLPLAGLRLF
jgi:hypothetical protein